MKTRRLYKVLVAGCFIFGFISLWNSEVLLRFYFRLPAYLVQFQNWGHRIIQRQIRTESLLDEQLQNVLIYWEFDDINAPLGEKLMQYASIDGIAQKYGLPHDCVKNGDIATLMEPPTAKPCRELKPVMLQNTTVKTITIDITRHYQKFRGALKEVNESSNAIDSASTKTTAAYIVMILKGTLRSYKKFAPDLKKRFRLPTLNRKSPLVRFLPSIQPQQQSALRLHNSHTKDAEAKVVVGIHVSRRLGVPPVSFFQHAMAYFRQRYMYSNVSFLVVSDHPLWCKDVLFHEQTSVQVIVDRFSEADGLALLAACSHAIVSAGVGSLGWWAAFLGDDLTQEGGEVVFFTDQPRLNATAVGKINAEFPTGWIAMDESGLFPIDNSTALSDAKGAGRSTNVCVNLDFEPKQKKAILTSLFVDHQGYVEGAVKLGESIRNHGGVSGDVDLVVVEMQSRSLPDDSWKLLHAAGWQRCVVDRLVAPIGKASLNSSTSSNSRFRDQFTKLHAWGLTMYETLIYMEPDTLVLGGIGPLIQTNLKTLDNKRLGASYEFVRSTRRWAESSFNLGVILLHPSETEYQRLLRLKENQNAPDVFPKFLNLVYRNQWHDFGFSYNADLALSSHGIPFWTKHHKSVRILHYTVQKPWSPCIQVYQDYCTLWENGGVMPVRKEVVNETSVATAANNTLELTARVEESPDPRLNAATGENIGNNVVPGKSSFTYDADILASLNVTLAQLETSESDPDAAGADIGNDFDFEAFAEKVAETSKEDVRGQVEESPKQISKDDGNDFDFDAFADKVAAAGT